MEDTFHACTGERPQLKHQGSASMMGKLDWPTRDGRLGILTTKEPVPHINAEDVTMTDTHYLRQGGGTSEEAQIQTRRTAEEW